MRFLEPVNTPQKSFYKKAKIENIGEKEVLFSYGTVVAYWQDGKLWLCDKWDYSMTTKKHVVEFARQKYNNREINVKWLRKELAC